MKGGVSLGFPIPPGALAGLPKALPCSPQERTDSELILFRCRQMLKDLVQQPLMAPKISEMDSKVLPWSPKSDSLSSPTVSYSLTRVKGGSSVGGNYM